MTDITERLCGPMMKEFGLEDLGNTAKNEIERLRARNAQLEQTLIDVQKYGQGEIERLRDELNTVHAHLTHMRNLADTYRGEIRKKP